MISNSRRPASNLILVRYCNQFLLLLNCSYLFNCQKQIGRGNLVEYERKSLLEKFRKSLLDFGYWDLYEVFFYQHRIYFKSYLHSYILPRLNLIVLILLIGSLKDKIRLFSQTILANTGTKDRQSNIRTTNQKTRRKNMFTTATTAKRRGQSTATGPFIPDLLQTVNPILMQSINNMENSFGQRQQPSYLLPNDMSLTYLLQNPLVHPGQAINEIHSHDKSSENSQKINLMMEQELFPQRDIKENLLGDIQIIFNSEENNPYSENGSSFPSDIQFQAIEDRENKWDSVSYQSKTKNNLSRRKEILSEIMDNGFIDEPIDEATAEMNLDQFEMQQREDLLRFQKQSTRKIQSELQNINENYFAQLQNSTLKDRKIYKIKLPQDASGNQDQQNNCWFDNKGTDGGKNIRQRGQKRRRMRNSHKKDKTKIILDTSIDQKLNCSLNSFSGNITNTSQDSIDNLSNVKLLQGSQEEYQFSKLKNNQLNAQHKQDQNLLINKKQHICKELESIVNFYSASPLNLNELQFLPQSDFIQQDNFTSNSAIHPLAQLDLIKNALDDIGYTKESNNKNTHPNTIKLQNQIYTTNLKKDKSLNSSFSYSNKQQSSEYSSQIGMVMHEIQFNSEKQLISDDYQQVFSNQGLFTARKDQESQSNHSKQDQLSQHSQQNKEIQFNDNINAQSSQKGQFHQGIYMSENKKNQMISYIPELNQILDPIIEGQTSLMMFQAPQDKTSFTQEEFVASPIYSQDNIAEINSVQTVHSLQNHDRVLSKEATQLLKTIVQKMKEKKQSKLELEKNFLGDYQMKSMIFYNLLSLKAANQIELFQRDALCFSPIEISIIERNV